MTLIRRTLSLSIASVCVANTSRTWLVPMPKAKSAEGAVGAGVAVAASERHARLGKPELRSDDVDDALVHAVQAEKLHAELCDVFFERLSQLFGFLIEKRPLAKIRRHDVIDRREGTIAKRDIHAVFAQHIERRRGGYFMNEMQSDEKLSLSRRQNADRCGIPKSYRKVSCRPLNILLRGDNIGRYR